MWQLELALRCALPRSEGRPWKTLLRHAPRSSILRQHGGSFRSEAGNDNKAMSYKCTANPPPNFLTAFDRSRDILSNVAPLIHTTETVICISSVWQVIWQSVAELQPPCSLQLPAEATSLISSPDCQTNVWGRTA